MDCKGKAGVCSLFHSLIYILDTEASLHLLSFVDALLVSLTTMNGLNETETTQVLNNQLSVCWKYRWAVLFSMSVKKILTQDSMIGKNGFGALCWRLKVNLESISGVAPCSFQYLDWFSEILKESFAFFSSICAFLVLNFFRFSHTPACHRAETTKMQQSEVCPRSYNSISQG